MTTQTLMGIRLITPCMEYEQSYRRYIAELGDEERYPFPMDFEYDDFSSLLRRIENFAKGLDLPPGFVPSTTYWLVIGDELVGASNLRHQLNDVLRNHGGHIGMGVRPSRRGTGLGKRVLAMTIEKAVAMGIREIHIHCHKDNQPSVKMIMANGGVLDSEGIDPGSGRALQRYVISV